MKIMIIYNLLKYHMQMYEWMFLTDTIASDFPCFFHVNIHKYFDIKYFDNVIAKNRWHYVQSSSSVLWMLKVWNLNDILTKMTSQISHNIFYYFPVSKWAFVNKICWRDWVPFFPRDFKTSYLTTGLWSLSGLGPHPHS